ncbi:flagellar hook-length control protein FliK [Vagococcus hydrophili]|uniref:Flagellar hook-length control protein FliK n=1 Tax=Vagococcus hydrophili TaxID=2714947 RepID=A0A6G8AWB6_9ENTE|nr:flagellar hook-length control protein FliK [Vagococcus hydrophili]QIL49348.1 flagellar hook-length control protein FliK [Vagococcus hydrophili]
MDAGKISSGFSSTKSNAQSNGSIEGIFSEILMQQLKINGNEGSLEENALPRLINFEDVVESLEDNQDTNETSQEKELPAELLSSGLDVQQDQTNVIDSDIKKELFVENQISNNAETIKNQSPSIDFSIRKFQKFPVETDVSLKQLLNKDFVAEPLKKINTFDLTDLNKDNVLSNKTLLDANKLHASKVEGVSEKLVSEIDVKDENDFDIVKSETNNSKNDSENVVIDAKNSEDEINPFFLKSSEEKISENKVIDSTKTISTKDSVVFKENNLTPIIEWMSEETGKIIEKGNSQFKVTLQPENLGNLDVLLELDNGKLTAKFLVDSNKVKELVNHNLPILQEALEKQNIVVSKTEVMLNMSNHSGSDFGGDLSQRQNQQKMLNEKKSQNNYDIKEDRHDIKESNNGDSVDILV